METETNAIFPPERFNCWGRKVAGFIFHCSISLYFDAKHIQDVNKKISGHIESM